MAEVKFPTEVVDLPSRGLLYPEDHPLASGKIELRYMTARDEDLITSPNLLKQGLVIDKLLESLIVTEGVNVDDLLAAPDVTKVRSDAPEIETVKQMLRYNLTPWSLIGS